MSVPISPLKVGSFVLGALFLALAMLLFFSSTTLFTKTQTYILYFEDSVKGLSSGSPVKFKGVPIGQVRKILISYNQDPSSSRVPVLVEIESEQLKQLAALRKTTVENVMAEEIQNSLRGQLQVESFITGMLSIELNYFPNAGDPVYIQKTRIYQEIPTVKSPFTNIGNGANDLLTRLAAVDFVKLGRSISRLADSSSKALDEVDMKALSGSLTSFLDASGKFLADGNAQGLGGSVAGLTQNLSRMTTPDGELTKTLRSLREASVEFASLSRELNAAARGDSQLGEKVHALVGNLANASEAVARLADYLERNPSALLTGKGDDEQ
jgi:paraquat-inducible protein B